MVEVPEVIFQSDVPPQGVLPLEFHHALDEFFPEGRLLATPSAFQVPSVSFSRMT